MIFKHHIPNSPVNEYLNSIIYFKGYNPEHNTERVVPDGFVHLIFELDGKERKIYHNDSGVPLINLSCGWLAPIQSNYLIISAHKDSEMIVAQFHPYGAFSVFPQSLGSTNEIMLQDLFIKELDLNHIRESILKASSPEEKISFLENSIYNSVEASIKPESYIKESTEAMRMNSDQKLMDLVQASGYSKKQFIQQFKKYIGITPKKYQRILRFNEILKRINEGKFFSWVDVSLDCGYYDQAHFIKDFKAFSGMNPTKFLDVHKTTDRINFFPLD